MKTYLSVCAFFICICFLNAQEIVGTIKDHVTNAPIPFVAVQTAEFKGVISNEEGVFVINLKDIDSNTIELTCLGYQSLTLSTNELKNLDYNIQLTPAINELGTVYLSNTKPNVDSIISKVKNKLKTNYKSDSLSYNFFYRETSYIDFDNLNLKVNKASHFKKRQLIEANEKLNRMSNEIMNGNFVYFTDYSGNLKVMNNEQQKLNIEKATKIINSNKNISLDNIQEKAQNIVLRYLDTTKTYKLKTGLFKVEDSMSLANDDNKNDNPNELDIKNLRKNTSSTLSKSKLGSSSMLITILNTDNYQYTLKNASFINNEMVYLIEFEPKRSRAHYTGSIYVSEDSYAILKLDYRYAKGKRGDKLNLRLILGVKYIENVSEGTIIYKKNNEDFYEPRYIKIESGEYFYINRPLKFIENSTTRNKTAFNFKIEGQTRHREELLFSNISKLDTSEFNTFKENKTITFETLRKYDAKIWSDKETLAPTTELKTFDAENE
ncbi:carboxypeptidase-like regulatory domain-containing protein [Ichthyenterobacterium magnum]|uniref:Carboxypeptidase-like protein n=1 Tax=Ichthyenterobacterium magnum TaxID=1230530 RepID=A0A420DM96_9FLAO|nr:carboxypeptidase-like regulatory domain-containing protein [Ichthyenterobacterium magnum]RKE95279.1 carboxypeptidase-like protein [Ichthyenterobacterium magnum]